MDSGMTRNLRNLAEFARDWLIAMALVIIACLGSGWCQTNLTPGMDLYLVWFGIWMIPFMLYANWRGVGRFLNRQTIFQFAVGIACLQTAFSFWGDILTWTNTWFNFAFMILSTYVAVIVAQWIFPDRDSLTENDTPE